MPNTNLRGIGWMIADASIMSLILLCGKVLGQRLIPPIEIVFLSNALATVISLSLLYRGNWGHIQPIRPVLHLYRAFFGVAATGCMLGALQHLRLLEISALYLTVPAITYAFSLRTFGEKRTLTLQIAMACSVAGVLMLIFVRPPLLNSSSSISVGLILGATSVLLSVLNNLNQKRIGAGEPIAATMIFGPLWSAVLAAPFSIYTWKPIGKIEATLILIYGALLICRMLTRYRAFQNSDVSVLMPFEYTQLLFSAALASYFFGQAVTGASAAGMTLITVGGLLVVQSQVRLARN